MSQFFSLQRLLIGLSLILIIQGSVLAGSETISSFSEGVEAYRSGNYSQAQQVFEQLMTNDYDNPRLMYYLAITHARQYDADRAKFYYNRAISLDPKGQVGEFAKKGLDNLPEATKLDAPPEMTASVTVSHPSQTAVKSTGYAGDHPANRGIVNQNTMPNQQVTGVPNINYGQQASYASPSGVSPQDMMALQSLMGGSGNQNNQNDWMTNMMSGMMGTPTANYPGMNAGMNAGMGSMQVPQQGMSPQNIDPQVFTQMMMNQMMGNFNFDSGNNDR